MRKCKFKPCSKYAYFGQAGTKIAEFCASHKDPNYVNVLARKCIYDGGCNTQPYYGISGTKTALFCLSHKDNLHVDVVSKKCIHDSGCLAVARYGKNGTRKREYCSNHLPDDSYIDVVHKKCAESNCNKKALFGILGSGSASHCKLHRPNTDYVHMSIKRCTEINCAKSACYGEVDSKLAIFCQAHKDDKHVNVRSKRCVEKDCEKHASCSKIGSKSVEYCASHCPDNYSNPSLKICVEPNCKTIASFGKEGSDLAEFCGTHQKAGYTNIKSKRCVERDCTTLASYGLPGYSIERCASHKLDGMILHPSRAKAEKKACDYCQAEIHYAEKFCSGCKQYQRTGKTVKLHEKELAIKYLLDELKIPYIHDRPIDNKCSKKRPDFFIQTEWGAIILEIDEHRHIRQTYNCDCEITRMRQIYMDVGTERVLFIRYNPDKYKSEVAQQTQPQRKHYLTRFLLRMINEAPKDNLSVCYLFYDHFDISMPEIEKFEAY